MKLANYVRGREEWGIVPASPFDFAGVETMAPSGEAEAREGQPHVTNLITLFNELAEHLKC
jgi:hypothetical protein